MSRSRSRDAARTSLRLQVWRRRASCTARRLLLGGSSTKKSATRVFSSLRTTSCSEHDPYAVCREVACLQNQSCSQPSIGTGKNLPPFRCLASRTWHSVSTSCFQCFASRRQYRSVPGLTGVVAHKPRFHQDAQSLSSEAFARSPIAR